MHFFVKPLQLGEYVEFVNADNQWAVQVFPVSRHSTTSAVEGAVREEALGSSTLAFPSDVTFLFTNFSFFQIQSRP